MTNPSKKEYRQATHRVHMEQERWKRELQKFKSSSPPPPSTNYTPPHSTQSPTHFGTLPKRQGSKGDEGVGGSMRPKMVGRSLPNERYPRSGSWNSHMRRSNPVLPSKYSTPPPERSNRSDHYEERGVDVKEGGGGGEDEEERQKIKQAQREAVRDFVIRRSAHSAGDLHSTTTSQSSPKKRPPPLTTTQPTAPSNFNQTPRNGAVSPASSREGSITPTNELPPMEDSLEEPTTPKDGSMRLAHSMDDLLDVGVGKRVTFSSAENLVVSSSPEHDANLPPPPQQQQAEKWGTAVEGRKERKASLPDNPMVIQELDSSPPLKRRLPSAGDVDSSQPVDSTWPPLTSPNRKKDKDVFRFLSQQKDPNYTVRRQQFQMNRILEKNKHVKQSIESLMGVQLSDDIGEWVMDGVLVCQLVNHLHPGMITTIHTPTEGQPLSLAKQTINIAAFIAACRKLNIPEEELCSAGDIKELKDPLRVITCLQRVLETAQ